MNDVNLNKKKNAVLGELDHLNSLIGLAKSYIKDRKVKNILTGIQNDIFVIQANVANPGNALHIPRNIGLDHIISVAKQTYLLERGLKSLDHFIIPEGSTDACFLHCLRTATRQIERSTPNYLKKPTAIARYLDQVAGLMFALARYVNKKQGFSERPPGYFRERQKPDSSVIANKRGDK